MHHLLQKRQWLEQSSKLVRHKGSNQTEGDPYQKSIEEFIAFLILFDVGWSFAFGVALD